MFGMNEINKDDKKGFKMYGSVAHNIYAENNISVESPAKLIEMLYEGVLRFNAQAKRAMKDKDIEKRVYWTNRSIAIITELISVLDMSHGDVAKYLEGLYNYEIQLLTDAGAHNDVSKLDEVTNVFKGLLEAWRETTDVAQ
jgi:flagellar protein FliS